MVCGNNKLSRTALHTPPTPSPRPTSFAPRTVNSANIERVARQAELSISSARGDVERSTTRAAVESALWSDQSSLTEARRDGLG
jgi:hypothetical protein